MEIGVLLEACYLHNYDDSASYIGYMALSLNIKCLPHFAVRITVLVVIELCFVVCFVFQDSYMTLIAQSGKLFHYLFVVEH